MEFKSTLCITRTIFYNYNLTRSLTTKRAAEVAYNFLQISIDFGAPMILQSDNGRQFTGLQYKISEDKIPEDKIPERQNP